jgi:hypothetical protein
MIFLLTDETNISRLINELSTKYFGISGILILLLIERQVESYNKQIMVLANHKHEWKSSKYNCRMEEEDKVVISIAYWRQNFVWKRNRAYVSYHL